ncbi:MAG: HD domain-containing protein, partial [Candidatus Methanoperedens sp.]|nr:HD domain-containing protein [Candidatus Methanoperedens sp.]
MKDRYNHLISKIIERKPNVDKFIEVLHTQTTWLTSPASTKYHLNKEGGLLEHSIGVAETLLQLRVALAPEISEEICVIVGLFHDIGKVGMPGKPYYLPELKDGMPTGSYTINPEIVAMGLSLRSLYLVSQYIPLSDAEAQAIAYHDGMYVP